MNTNPIVKQLVKNKKRIRDSNSNNKNIQSGYRNGIWHRKCVKLIMKSRKKTNNKTELPNQERIRALGEKENYEYKGILEADTIKQAEMKESQERIRALGEKANYK